MRNHKILKVAAADTRLQKTFSQELKISPITAQVLVNRGLNTLKEAQGFLGAGLRDLADPYSFADMRRAVAIIKKAIKDKKKIMVFGDYDVDGITALALLKDTLFKMGAQPLHYLPHRIKDGYGLSDNALPLAKQQGVKLFITVDCGTNSRSQVQQLRRLGIEVVITDHHEPVGQQPDGFAYPVINPKLKSSGYKYRGLAGVGVAYRLCQALRGTALEDELDLVSLGTVADVVPLTGENRILVKEGLSEFANTGRPGLRALIEASGIRNKKITTYSLSYILGPRINASGRMDSAETALELLMSDDCREASRLAAVIEGHNRQRQKVESRMLEEAEDLINREVNFKEHKVIVVAKQDWHQGVLGVVAAKLADRFYRPTIVISLSEDLCKGSGRSIKNFHLFEALKDCQDSLRAFGGHSHAVGLIITKDSVEDFKNRINDLARDRLVFEDLLPTLEVDMELRLADINAELAVELNTLEPFGTGNPEPLFYSRGLGLKGEPQVLGRDTLKFWVSDGLMTMQAIGFGMAGFRDNLVDARSFDLVYGLRLDTWQGEESLLLEAKDIFFR